MNQSVPKTGTAEHCEQYPSLSFSCHKTLNYQKLGIMIMIKRDQMAVILRQDIAVCNGAFSFAKMESTRNRSRPGDYNPSCMLIRKEAKTINPL